MGYEEGSFCDTWREALGHGRGAFGTVGTQRELCRTRRVEWLGGCNSREQTPIAVARPTVEQLVDEDKVVLDVLLRDLAEVRLHDADDLEQELEHHRCVHILLRHGRQPDVGTLYVEEAGARDVRDGRTDLLSRVDHVHAERVDGIPPARVRSFATSQP